MPSSSADCSSIALGTLASLCLLECGAHAWDKTAHRMATKHGPVKAWSTPSGGGHSTLPQSDFRDVDSGIWIWPREDHPNTVYFQSILQSLFGECSKLMGNFKIIFPMESVSTIYLCYLWLCHPPINTISLCTKRF